MLNSSCYAYPKKHLCFQIGAPKKRQWFPDWSTTKTSMVSRLRHCKSVNGFQSKALFAAVWSYIAKQYTILKVFAWNNKWFVNYFLLMLMLSLAKVYHVMLLRAMVSSIKHSVLIWKPLTFLQCPNLETIDVFAVLQSGNHWRFCGAPIWKQLTFFWCTNLETWRFSGVPIWKHWRVFG